MRISDWSSDVCSSDLSMGQALWVIMIVAGPPLILMFVIGFVISIIQTATSINEPTISFIPKLLMLVLFLAIYGAIAGDLRLDYTCDLWIHFPDHISLKQTIFRKQVE